MPALCLPKALVSFAQTCVYLRSIHESKAHALYRSVRDPPSSRSLLLNGDHARFPIHSLPFYVGQGQVLPGLEGQKATESGET